MRTTQYPFFTLKETPADAEIISHQLMLRAGLIRKLASGLYTWLPIGLRVLKKIATIVREEMNRAGAIEISMPLVQPADLWRTTNRWEQYGPELLRFTDRHQRWFVIGPTHEEVIIHLIRNEISSYKQLPLNLYQIHTKFRDEIRPRFGVIRAREFLMKDSYSFHTSHSSLQATYAAMYQTYHRIFTRLGLNFRAVRADSGAMGGNYSHEFQVIADSGEDAIALSATSDYAANVELAEAVLPYTPRPEPHCTLQLIDLGQRCHTQQLAKKLHIPLQQIVKTTIVRGQGKHPWVALLLRADHCLNATKVVHHPLIANPLTLASEAEVHAIVGAHPDALGPIHLSLPIIMDRAVSVLSDFAAGANRDGEYYIGINWERDLPLAPIADLRQVVTGDPSPDGLGQLQIKRGIEVGHLFQLGTQYSCAFNASIQDEQGSMQPLFMGCYGIGISRIVAAAIEQQHDSRGILWPEAISPFQIGLLAIKGHKTPHVLAAAEKLYQQLLDQGVEVLFDDRPIRIGSMLTDMELIGIPLLLLMSEQQLLQERVECKWRRCGKTEYLPLAQAVDILLQHFKKSPQNMQNAECTHSIL